MTTTADVPVVPMVGTVGMVGVGQPVPTLAEEMRGTLLLFGMFGLAFALLGVAVGTMVLLQTVLGAGL